jgi:hypothetical protein
MVIVLAPSHGRSSAGKNCATPVHRDRPNGGGSGARIRIQDRSFRDRISSRLARYLVFLIHQLESVRIAADDLVRVAGAQLADICE